MSGGETSHGVANVEQWWLPFPGCHATELSCTCGVKVTRMALKSEESRSAATWAFDEHRDVLGASSPSDGNQEREKVQ